MRSLLTLLAVLALALLTACGATEPADVEITSARITEPIAGRTVSLGGFQLVAKGEDVKLVEVTSEAANRIELHTMLNEDGVMKMRRLPDGLIVPAGQSLTLGSGGPHLMVFGLKSELVAGDTVTLNISYKQGEQIRTKSVSSIIQTLGDETGTANN